MPNPSPSPNSTPVKEMLLQYQHVLYGAFDYLSVLYSDQELAAGEPDCFNISFNAFMSFASTVGLVSKKVTHGEFETIWSVVNAVDDATKGVDRHNSVRTLNRQEWIQALVRCAVAVYIPRDQQSGNVCQAVEMLMKRNLLAHLPAAAVQNSNVFRKKLCYHEKVSTVLEAAKSSIRTFYRRYAEVSQTTGDALRDDEHMSMGEWLAFVTHMGLIESKQLTLFTAKMVFMWSRIRSADERAQGAVESGAKAAGLATVLDASESRLHHIFLVDFMEALVRMSTLVALPTELEVEEAGASDAGDFLIAMQRNSPRDQYERFLTSHRSAHTQLDGSDWDDYAAMPLWRRLEALLKLLIRTVEYNTSAMTNEAAANGIVEDEEIKRFLRQRSHGHELKLRASVDERTDLGAAIHSAKAKQVVYSAALKVQMARRAKIARAKVKARRMTMKASLRIQAALRARLARMRVNKRREEAMESKT